MVAWRSVVLVCVLLLRWLLLLQLLLLLLLVLLRLKWLWLLARPPLSHWCGEARRRVGLRLRHPRAGVGA